MAFDYTKWQRWSSGYDLSNSSMWNYTDSASTIAQLTTAGFLNPAAGQLAIGDLIWLVSSDVPNGIFYQVTAVTGNVTLAAYSASAASYMKVAMTAAQWNGMYAAPFLLIPAPGAGMAILVKQITVAMTFVTTQFAAGGAVIAQYEATIHGAGSNSCGTDTIAAAVITGFAASGSAGMLGRIPIAGIADATFVNQGVYLSNQTGAFTTGDGTFNIHCFYSIVTL